MTQERERARQLPVGVVVLSGSAFALFGVANLLRGFDGLSLLVAFIGVTVASSPLRHRVGRGAAGSGQILWNGLVVAAVIAGIGVFALVAALDSLGSGRVGGDVAGIWGLATSALMLIVLAWLSRGLRKSWSRWRGQ
jgi:hypothetical protein